MEKVGHTLDLEIKKPIIKRNFFMMARIIRRGLSGRKLNMFSFYCLVSESDNQTFMAMLTNLWDRSIGTIN